jgi:DNA-binding NarL/FixJ family response regulator
MNPGEPLIRLIVLADDPLVRADLASALDDREQFNVVAQFPRSELKDLDLDLIRAEILLIDEGWGGSEHQSGEEMLDLPVLRMVDPAEIVSRTHLSIDSVISREASPEAIGIALQAVLMGWIVRDPLSTGRGRRRAEDIDYETLTEREREVLELVADGLTNRAIANQLEISENTVKFHVNAILSKLNAQSRTEAVMVAARVGLIPL